MHVSLIRDIILIIGWPLLVSVSSLIVFRGYRFNKGVEGNPLGALILRLMWALVITMFSLGVVATFFMFYSPVVGVYIVLPIFIVWFFSIVTILISVPELEAEFMRINVAKETVKKMLDDKAQELYKERMRSAEASELVDVLQRERDRLNSLTKIMFGRENRIAELKQEIEKLKKADLPYTLNSEPKDD